MSEIIAKNPVAYHNYFIEDKIEAGIVLTGTEIKSIRAGKVNLKDSYATIKNGQAYVFGMHISPYEHGNIYNKDPLRERKLLLNRSEINRLVGIIKQKGLTLVPISLYFTFLSIMYNEEGIKIINEGCKKYYTWSISFAMTLVFPYSFIEFINILKHNSHK